MEILQSRISGKKLTTYKANVNWQFLVKKTKATRAIGSLSHKKTTNQASKTPKNGKNNFYRILIIKKRQQFAGA
ncbi:hypothetical protein [Vibrio metoecus]|uniref:hypothetical protein n=1 Tax=Vibrio metoecus TaxID=1481663 RepID=UPI0006D82A88|nr:hypothetical protein [Vibrio metoecus]KQA18247.1 hypothetical protein AAY54_10575 [Vibrio metoecus]